MATLYGRHHRPYIVWHTMWYTPACRELSRGVRPSNFVWRAAILCEQPGFCDKKHKVKRLSINERYPLSNSLATLRWLYWPLCWCPLKSQRSLLFDDEQPNIIFREDVLCEPLPDLLESVWLKSAISTVLNWLGMVVQFASVFSFFFLI